MSQSKTMWTITYASGARSYVNSEEEARIEALSNPAVVGIRAPLYR